MFRFYTDTLFRKLFISLGVIFYLNIAGELKAQQFDFHPIGVPSPSECYQVLQDNKGYIWFSTDKGLYKYNGYSIKHFTVADGLPDNVLFKLYENSKGYLFFTSLPGIIGYIHNDSVTIPKLNNQLGQFLNHGRDAIFDLYEDSSHIFWISSYNGLFKTIKPDDYSVIEKVPLIDDSCHTDITILNTKALLSFHFFTKQRFIGDSVVSKLLICKNKSVNTIQYLTKHQETSASFGKALLLKNGTLLVSLYTHLFIIYPSGKFKVQTYNEQILYIYQDKSGGVWLGFHKNGVAYYNDCSITGEPIWSLTDYSVSSITEDSEGGLWVSTLEKGIFHASTKGITDYCNIFELSNKITSIGVLNDEVFINDRSNVLSVISGEKMNSYEMAPANKPDIIYDYLKYDHQIMVATSTCLMKTDSTLKKWNEIRYKNSSLKRHAVIYSMSSSPDNKVYAVNMGSFMMLDQDSVVILDVLPARGRCIQVTSKNEIFIGCINGLYKYTDHKFVYLGEKNNVFKSKVNALKEDRNGNLWVLTMISGVILYKDNKIVQTISKENGLPSNNCSDVVFDTSGMAWLGTDNGVCKINPVNKSIEVFNSNSGLISDEVTKLGLNNNKLWIGTGNGLCMMNLTLAKKNNFPPPIYIASITVNDSLISSKNVFPYKLNNFRIQLNGLSYRNTKCRYLYRLIGLDTTWHSSDYYEITFYNLAPGAYEFQAEALNSEGIYSIKPAVFSFVIEKPFWLTWWFISSVIVVVMLMVVLFIRGRLNVIHKKEEEKTKINKMLAEYQLTALRTQMNPHFIFNAINSIQHYVLENNSEIAYDYLTKFAHLIRMMLNNAQEKNLSLQHELDMLMLYVELERLRFDDGFEFVLNVDEDISAADIFIPALLIQPYVENAIWHGLMNLKGLRRGKLEVVIQLVPGKVIIQIRDNGVGREKAKELQKRSTHKSIGMELNRKRMELLNSLLKSEQTTIEIIDLYDANGSSNGTLVEINLAIEEF